MILGHNILVLFDDFSYLKQFVCLGIKRTKKKSLSVKREKLKDQKENKKRYYTCLLGTEELKKD